MYSSKPNLELAANVGLVHCLGLFQVKEGVLVLKKCVNCELCERSNQNDKNGGNKAQEGKRGARDNTVFLLFLNHTFFCCSLASSVASTILFCSFSHSCSLRSESMSSAWSWMEHRRSTSSHFFLYFCNKINK